MPKDSKVVDANADSSLSVTATWGDANADNTIVYDPLPDDIADAVKARLTADGYDAFRPGSYHDISTVVHQAIVEEITKRLPPSS